MTTAKALARYSALLGGALASGFASLSYTTPGDPTRKNPRNLYRLLAAPARGRDAALV
jgi:hypothetical protein